MNAYTSPETGIRMDASIYDLARDTMQIDTIRAEMHQDSLGLLYSAQVIKNKYRRNNLSAPGWTGKYVMASATPAFISRTERRDRLVARNPGR